MVPARYSRILGYLSLLTLVASIPCATPLHGGSLLGANPCKGILGISYPLFHPESGKLTARFKADSLALDFGDNGLFRVAWKPQVKISGAVLEICDEIAWNTTSKQLDDLIALSGGSQLVVSNTLRIRLPARDTELCLEEVKLTEQGTLRCRHVTVSSPAGSFSVPKLEWAYRSQSIEDLLVQASSQIRISQGNKSPCTARSLAR